MEEYEIIIGLEVHVELLTKSKMFCSCSTEFGSPPNKNICPVCTGMPGVLPVINKKAVELAIKTAIVFNSNISSFCRFARKNYFYPDLPKNYQISQYEEPLATGGFLEVDGRKINFKRIHLEEDAGKLLHSEKGNFSYVDFNRSGIPLLEMVTEPDIRSPEEAEKFLEKLKKILEYLEISDCNMEEGSLRCDANISVRKKGENLLGVKTEVKNMNSFKSVRKALLYESKRQIEILKKGERIIQETRLWNEKQQITEPMRTKEEAHDYRYFPEPDRVPLEIDEKWISEIKSQIGELPDERKERFKNQYKLSDYDANVLTSQKGIADYFEECVKLYKNPKIVANWIMDQLLSLTKGKILKASEIPLKS
jgi:aspartyl-tRNA(Asn)/glutamyl-tRNA(Gln) amidotransferase subunit B